MIEPKLRNPRPRHYFTSDEGIGGRIKVRPEDFIVDEIPIYEPCGEGEHLYLRVQKSGVSHGELISCIRRCFRVRESAIGYAGMKDKQAVSSQTVSVHLLEDPPEIDLAHSRIKLLWAERHRNKIRRGHLRGNRFSVRIRDVDPTRVVQAQRIVRQLEKTGVPAHFGPQRFGYRFNNHVMGALLLRGEWEGLLRELLGATGSTFPEYQRERREMFDAGRYEDVLPTWGPADRAERAATSALLKGNSARHAVHATGPVNLNFWASAMVSAAFNHVLDRRIDEGLVHQLVEGDMAWKHDSRAVFAVTAETLRQPDLRPRLDALEISPSGPLWGSGMPVTSGAVGEIELEALEAVGVSESQIMDARYHPTGGRRPFRAILQNVDLEGGFDEHGSFVRLAFDLPRGTYATVALREIMKNDGVAELESGEDSDDADDRS